MGSEVSTQALLFLPEATLWPHEPPAFAQALEPHWAPRAAPGLLRPRGAWGWVRQAAVAGASLGRCFILTRWPSHPPA